MWKKRIFRFVCGIVVIGCLLVCGLTGYVYTRVSTFSTELNQAIKLTTETIDNGTVQFSLPTIQTHIQAAQAALDEANMIMLPTTNMAQRLSHLPRIGETVEEGIALWHFANAGTTFADELLQAGLVGLEQYNQGQIPAVLAVFPQLEFSLNSAESAFQNAEKNRSKLTDLAWLPDTQAQQAKTALTTWDSFAPLADSSFDTIRQGAAILPILLSQDRPSTYLLMVQSGDELRPTGGMITSVGTVEIKSGELLDFQVLDVLDAENDQAWGWEDTGRRIQPPRPIERYLGLGNWVLRDANWWVDFHTSAEQVVSFWEQSGRPRPDGVIAVNEKFFETLLQTIGPIQVSSGEVVSAENFKTTVLNQFYVTEDGRWVREPGTFIRTFANSLIATLRTYPPQKIPALLPTVQAAIAEKQILITSFDETTAAILHDLKLDGSLPNTNTDDFWYFVESNISYTKSSQMQTRDVHYRVDLDETLQVVTATLFMTATNAYAPEQRLEGYPDYYYDGGIWDEETRTHEFWEGYYGGYFRWVVPAGATLLNAEGIELESAETRSAFTVWGGYIQLDQGASQTIMLQWRPPVTQNNPDQYSVMVQKQPGAPDYALQTTIYVNSPKDATIAPEPTIIMTDRITWQQSLSQDIRYTLAR